MFSLGLLVGFITGITIGMLIAAWANSGPKFIDVDREYQRRKEQRKY